MFNCWAVLSHFMCEKKWCLMTWFLNKFRDFFQVQTHCGFSSPESLFLIKGPRFNHMVVSRHFEHSYCYRVQPDAHVGDVMWASANNQNNRNQAVWLNDLLFRKQASSESVCKHLFSHQFSTLELCHLDVNAWFLMSHWCHIFLILSG